MRLRLSTPLILLIGLTVAACNDSPKCGPTHAGRCAVEDDASEPDIPDDQADAADPLASGAGEQPDASIEAGAEPDGSIDAGDPPNAACATIKLLGGGDPSGFRVQLGTLRETFSDESGRFCFEQTWYEGPLTITSTLGEHLSERLSRVRINATRISEVYEDWVDIPYSARTRWGETEKVVEQIELQRAPRIVDGEADIQAVQEGALLFLRNHFGTPTGEIFRYGYPYNADLWRVAGTSPATLVAPRIIEYRYSQDALQYAALETSYGPFFFYRTFEGSVLSVASTNGRIDGAVGGADGIWLGLTPDRKQMLFQDSGLSLLHLQTRRITNLVQGTTLSSANPRDVVPPVFHAAQGYLYYWPQEGSAHPVTQRLMRVKLSGGAPELVVANETVIGVVALSELAGKLAWFEEPTQDGQARLMLGNIDGTAASAIGVISTRLPNQIGSIYTDPAWIDPQFTADGKSLLYRVDGALHLHRLDGSGDVELGTLRSAVRQTPDGAWLIFQVLASAERTQGTYVVRTDGTGLHHLGANVDESRVSISPDSSHVLYYEIEPPADLYAQASSGKLHIARMDGSEHVVLSEQARFDAVFAPKSDIVAFSANPSDPTLHLVTRTGVERAHYDKAGYASFSPEGTRFVFASSEDGVSTWASVGSDGVRHLHVRTRFGSTVHWRDETSLFVEGGGSTHLQIGVYAVSPAQATY